MLEGVAYRENAVVGDGLTDCIEGHAQAEVVLAVISAHGVKLVDELVERVAPHPLPPASARGSPFPCCATHSVPVWCKVSYCEDRDAEQQQREATVY